MKIEYILVYGLLLFAFFLASCDSSFMSNNGYIEDIEVFDVSSSRTLQTGETKYDQMFSLYNEDLTDHIYVRSESEEVDHLINNGYVNQGIAFFVATSNKYDDKLMPLYRMYNQSLSDHIYTINVKEKEDLEGIGYVSQGIRGYVYGINDKGKTRQRIYRYYKGNKSDSDHIYSSQSEIDNTYMPQGHRWYEPNFVVFFSDPNLENEIRNIINKPTGDIYKNDLVGLTTIDLSCKEIKSLEGIEFCINLQSLDLSVNSITDIKPIEKLTNLNALYLGINSINDISPLSSLKNLTSLGLNWNQIDNIDSLKELSLLYFLEIANNSITDITSLGKITNLKVLCLSTTHLDLSYESDNFNTLQELKKKCYIDIYNDKNQN